ncbi:hypothetical protein QTN47_20020 [Danxiaibacter flavus]|uniref:DUF2383 domain-containing protein n=1 Tax=Danxiaibacter flavus TaxID=3049108 RepID=A0ABV3ZKZ4_9BACT|nr:hypothetical protein QNM32_20030 [Chitinophagaceae bacterium DXS]
MKQRQNISELLHDLSMIHENRITNYLHVLQHSDNLDLDLRKIMANMMEESRLFQYDLDAQKSTLDGVTIGKPGPVYQHWKNEQKQFDATPRQPFLASCETEQATLKNTYEYALQNDLLDEVTRSLIDDQLQTLDADLDHRQKYMDAL